MPQGKSKSDFMMLPYRKFFPVGSKVRVVSHGNWENKAGTVAAFTKLKVAVCFIDGGKKVYFLPKNLRLVHLPPPKRKQKPASSSDESTDSSTSTGLRQVCWMIFLVTDGGSVIVQTPCPNRQWCCPFQLWRVPCLFLATGSSLAVFVFGWRRWRG